MTTMDLRERLRQRITGEQPAPVGDLRARLKDRLSAVPRETSEWRAPPGTASVVPEGLAGIPDIGGAAATGTLNLAGDMAAGAGIVAGEAIKRGPSLPGFLKGAVVGGLGRLLESVGVDNPLTDAGDQIVMQAIDSAERWEPVAGLVEVLANANREQIRAFSDSLGYERSEGPVSGLVEDVAGSVPHFAGGIATAAGGTAVAGPVGGLLAGAAYFGATESLSKAAQIRDTLVGQGMDPAEARAAAATGAAVYGAASGALEFVGLAPVLRATRFFKHLDGVVAKSAARRVGARAAGVVGAGAGEAVTEDAQSIVGAAVTDWLSNEEGWGELQRYWGDLDARGRQALVSSILGSSVRGGIELWNPTEYGSLEEARGALAQAGVGTQPGSPAGSPGTQQPAAAPQAIAAPQGSGGEAPISPVPSASPAEPGSSSRRSEPSAVAVAPSTTASSPSASQAPSPNPTTPRRTVAENLPPQPDQVMPDGTAVFRDGRAAERFVAFRNERLEPGEPPVRAVEVMRGAEGSPWAVVPDTRLQEARARGERQTAEVEGFTRSALDGGRGQSREMNLLRRQTTPEPRPATTDQTRPRPTPEAPSSVGRDQSLGVAATLPGQAVETPASPVSSPSSSQPPTPKDTREPWEMTRREFVKEYVWHATDRRALSSIQAEGMNRGTFGVGRKKPKAYPGDVTIYVRRADVEALNPSIESFGRGQALYPEGSYSPTKRYAGGAIPPDRLLVTESGTDPHRAAVESAVARGLPVPPEVLAEYPELAVTAPEVTVKGAERTVEVPKPPVASMTRADLLTEATALGVDAGPKSRPALAKRVEGARRWGNMLQLQGPEYGRALQAMPDAERREFLAWRQAAAVGAAKSRAGTKAAATRTRKAKADDVRSSTPQGRRAMDASAKIEQLGRSVQAGASPQESEWIRAREELDEASLAERLLKAATDPHVQDVRKDQDAEPFSLGAGPSPVKATREGGIPWRVKHLDGSEPEIISGAEVRDNIQDPDTRILHLYGITKDTMGGTRGALLVHFPAGDAEVSRRARRMVWQIANGKSRTATTAELRAEILGEDNATAPEFGDLSGGGRTIPVNEMDRAAALAEAERLGVAEGPKSAPALRKRIEEARATATPLSPPQTSSASPSERRGSTPDSETPQARTESAARVVSAYPKYTTAPQAEAGGGERAELPDPADMTGPALRKEMIAFGERPTTGDKGVLAERVRVLRERAAGEAETIEETETTAPWQMTADEWEDKATFQPPSSKYSETPLTQTEVDVLRLYQSNSVSDFAKWPDLKAGDVATPAQAEAFGRAWSAYRTAKGHKSLVELAVSEGRPVPQRVLDSSGISSDKADAGSVASRLRVMAEQMEQNARAANAKLNIPRGRNIGATLPPAYYANLVKIGAAKILKGAAKFSEWAAEMRAEIGDFRVNMRKLYRDATEEYRRLIDAGSVVEESGESVKAIVRDATGQTDTSPAVETKTTEAKALRSKLSAEEKATHLAYRAGLRAARDELPAIRAKLRDAMKLKAGARADTIQGIRDEIRHLVETNLPPEFRGRFLPEVTKATSLGDLARAIHKLRRESARATGQQDLRQIKRMARYARLLPRRRPEGSLMSPREAFDAGLQEAIELAEKFKRTGRAVVTTEDVEAAADRLMDLKSEMGGAIADAMAAKRIFLATKRGTAEQHAQDLAAEIRKRPSRERPGSADDVRTPLLARGNLLLRDLRNIAEALEGKRGIVYALIVQRMQMQHEAYLTALRGASDRLDAIVRGAGYEGVADAIARLSGRRGEGVTERVTVTLGGRDWGIAKGELMSLAAMDQQTRHRIRAGSPIQFQRGRRRVPLRATLEEIDAAVGQLSADDRAMVEELKGLIETYRDEAFEAHFRLKGYYPEGVDGYWPSKRNTQFSPTKGMPEGWRGISQRFMENAGFLKAREGGRLPYVVGDAMTVAMEHVDSTLKLIHLAESTRDAAAVIEAPDVVSAVNERFGTSYNTALRDYLLAVSLANEADATTAGRAVQWMNQNLAVGKLGLNPSTWLKQIGGIPRLAAQMPTRAFADGLKGWRDVSTTDLIGASGYFWERYAGNVAGRFTPVGGESYADIGKATGKLGLEEAVANVVSAAQRRSLGDLKAAIDQVRNAAATSLEVLNAFDAVNARIAYAGWRAEAGRRYPAWDQAERDGWAMTKAAESVRETQNSSSVLDAPLVGIRSRGRGGSAFLVFTSDVFKARNRLEAAARRGRAEFARHAAAEAVNILWGRAVGWGIGAGVAATVIALGGDEDDWDDWRGKYLDPERELFNAARDVVSLVDPVVTPELMAMVRFQGAELSAPALDAVNQSAAAVFRDVPSAAMKAAEDSEKIDDFAVKLGRAANTVSGALGVNPIEAMMDRVLRQIDAQNEPGPSRPTRERRERR